MLRRWGFEQLEANIEQSWSTGGGDQRNQHQARHITTSCQITAPFEPPSTGRLSPTTATVPSGVRCRYSGPHLQIPLGMCDMGGQSCLRSSCRVITEHVTKYAPTTGAKKTTNVSRDTVLLATWTVLALTIGECIAVPPCMLRITLPRFPPPHPPLRGRNCALASGFMPGGLGRGQ